MNVNSTLFCVAHGNFVVYSSMLCISCVLLGILKFTVLCISDTNTVDSEHQHLQNVCHQMYHCHMCNQEVLILIHCMLHCPSILVQFLGQSKQNNSSSLHKWMDYFKSLIIIATTIITYLLVYSPAVYILLEHQNMTIHHETQFPICR